MLDRAHTGRYQFMRIDIVDAAQIELAARRYAPAFRDQLDRVERGKILAPTQMPLAIRKQGMARLGNRAAEANRSQRILQRTPAARMHVHIAAGDEVQGVMLAQRLQLGQQRDIVSAVMQLDGDPGASAEMPDDPCCGCFVGAEGSLRAE